MTTTLPTTDRDTVRARVRAALREDCVDGYLAYTPSNVYYVSGYLSYFLTHWWRMHGTVLAVLGTDEAVRPGLVVGDAEEKSARASGTGCDIYPYRTWVETRGLAEIQAQPEPPTGPRPAQFRESEIDDRVRVALEERGLLRGRVGTDLRFILHHSYERLRRVAPQVEWVDVSETLYRVRSVKLPFETDALTRAARLAEHGMTHAARQAQPGMSLGKLRALFTEGVARAAVADDRFEEFSDFWVIPGMGSQASISSSAGAGNALRPGDLIKFDCGTTVAGYRSDSGRTFCLGQPAAEAQRLYSVLRDAHRVAVDSIRPGVPASEVYVNASRFVHQHGYPGYIRGHFGHSVGIDTFHEEPPFLAAEDHTPLRAGMVLAVETPFYGGDIGPIMIEDLVEVTDDGARYLTQLPRDLLTAGR